MTGQVWWYSARAAGLVAWVLLSMSAIWGLVLSTKLRPPRIRPNWTLDLHRFLGGLAVIFTGVHVGSVMLDSYVHFGVTDLLVPFASSWKPVAVAWGVVGVYLLLAVELSSLARRRLPVAIWRRLHSLAFPLFIVATIHLVGAGTDGRTTLALASVAAVGLTIAALTAWRVHLSRTVSPRPRSAAGSASRRTPRSTPGSTRRPAPQSSIMDRMPDRVPTREGAMR